MKKHDIYIYGMTVMSTIHMLKGSYPQADTYGEIVKTHHVPGGETCNSAIILANLGYSVKIDGPYLGRDSREGIEYFCNKYEIDCSNMTYDDTFIGIKDIVLVGDETRTVFGWFQQYFGDDNKRWTQPDYAAIDAAKLVGLDPYFPETSQKVAEYCAKTGKDYVSIDSRHDSVIAQHAAAIIISKEYIKNTYPEIGYEDLMDMYRNGCDGLIVFTFGKDDILYSKRGECTHRVPTYDVEVLSTLGAGDTFRAGIMYGVINGYSDRDIVRFAAATSGSVISRFPMALDPPTLGEIKNLMSGK